MNKPVMIGATALGPAMRGIGVVQVMEVMEVASVPARTLREGVGE